MEHPVASSARMSAVRPR